MNLRVAPNSHHSALPSTSSPGSPRSFTPPAAPLKQALGRPSPCISGFAGDGSPSCPESRILRRCRLTDLRVAPHLGLSVSPTIRFSGCPESRIFRHRLMDFRVTSDRAPSGCAIEESSSYPESSSLATSIGQFPGCPKSWVFRRCRLTNPPSYPEFSALRRCRFSIFRLPRFRFHGWVDDESPTVLELCILSLRCG